MPPPPPQGFLGTPKSPFLACLSRHLQLPSPGWQGSNAEKTNNKILIPRTLFVSCGGGGGRSRARGPDHFSLSLSCFALEQQIRFNCEQSHQWFSSSGLRCVWAHYAVLSSGDPIRSSPSNPWAIIRHFGWVRHPLWCSLYCRPCLCFNTTLHYFMQIQKQANLNFEVELCEMH